VLQLQNLQFAPPEVEPDSDNELEPGQLKDEDEDEDEPMSAIQAFQTLMICLVHLVAVEEEGLGEACGKALVRLAAGSKMMALKLAPVLVRSLGHYMKPEERKKGVTDTAKVSLIIAHMSIYGNNH